MHDKVELIRQSKHMCRHMYLVSTSGPGANPEHHSHVFHVVDNIMPCALNPKQYRDAIIHNSLKNTRHTVKNFHNEHHTCRKY